jgi:hypothetical protein
MNIDLESIEVRPASAPAKTEPVLLFHSGKC